MESTSTDPRPSDREVGAPDRPAAVITGASSGIGEVYARLLADEGHNLLLIARRESVLEKIRQEIESKHGVAVEVLSADLADPEALRRAEHRIAAMRRIDYMINNAGFGLNRRFPDVDVEAETTMLRLHVVATMRLTHAALGPMCQRKGGYLINVASLAAFLVGPGAADYCATKAYMVSFSRCLAYDLKPYNIRIQALCPGMTVTEFHDTKALEGFQRSQIPGYLWVPAEDVVRSSLRAIRKRRPSVVHIPTLRYRVFRAVVNNPITGPLLRTMFADRAQR